VPELFLREGILKLKLRFHFFPCGEQGETGVRGAERVGRQRIQGELHASAVDELFAESFVGLLLAAGAFIEAALASGLVIDVKVPETEPGAGLLAAAQDQVDSSADAAF
jgi:hypothetical protein